MKVLAKPIDMICWVDEKGNMNPIKFRITTQTEEKEVYKILRVYRCDNERIAGNKIRKYTCEIRVNDTIKLCEIRYELDSCKWMLFKI